MKRLAFLAVSALAMAGCGRDSKAESDNAQKSAGAGPGTQPAEASSARATRHVALLDAPASGPVAPIVRDAVAGAAGEHRTLVVYVGAPWCEPCQRFHGAAARGELDSMLSDVALLEFDMDRDRERLTSAGYVSKYIPLFALPAQDGSASGKQIEGGIKGEGAVGFIVPRLRAMLAE